MMSYSNVSAKKMIFLCLTVFVSCLVVARASDGIVHPKEIIVTLYFAQNGEGVDDLVANPRLRDNLVKLFGYKNYQRVGVSMVYPHSFSPVTAWPNKLYALTVQAVNPSSPRYEFELKQEEISILKGSFIPKPSIPIIIKGPLYDQGQLILVVETVQL